MHLFEIILRLPNGETGRLLVIARDGAQACQLVARRGAVLEIVVQQDTLPVRGEARILGSIQEHATDRGVS